MEGEEKLTVQIKILKFGIVKYLFYFITILRLFKSWIKQSLLEIWDHIYQTLTYLAQFQGQF